VSAETKVWTSTQRVRTAEVKAKSTFGLTIGEVRQLVAAADELGLDDDQDVFAADLRSLADRPDRFWVGRLTVSQSEAISS
jgi:hypothetical protein